MEKQEKDHQEMKPLVTDFQVMCVIHEVTDSTKVQKGYVVCQDTLISVNYNTHGYDIAKEGTPVPPHLINDLEGLLQSLESMDDFSFS